jgi:hypothetical protein
LYYKITYIKIHIQGYIKIILLKDAKQERGGQGKYVVRRRKKIEDRRKKKERR